MLGTTSERPFRILWMLAVFPGAGLSLDLTWLIADTLNALMAIPNLISLLLRPVKQQYTKVGIFETAIKISVNGCNNRHTQNIHYIQGGQLSGHELRNYASVLPVVSHCSPFGPILGAVTPKCVYAAGVAMRPRGVRCRKPC